MTRKKSYNSNIEELRRIISNIQAAMQPGIKSILITSTLAREGKTFITANLAKILADSRKKTLIIDFNLHRPGVHEFFKLINSKGISDYLTAEIPLKDAIKESKNNMLHFMLAGFQKVNFNTLLDSARCREMFANLKEVYDYILIDSPAISDSSDALVLAKYADTSIFVVQAGKLDRKKVIRCKESLERVNPNILGVIVNKSGKYF
jgi:protein-tyrosine kinase